MEAAFSSEILVNIYQATQRHVPEDEMAGVAVKPYTLIREMLCLISVETSAVVNLDFHGFRQSLEANIGIVPRLGHDRFLPNSF
jgi:hypothetical protein